MPESMFLILICSTPWYVAHMPPCATTTISCCERPMFEPCMYCLHKLSFGVMYVCTAKHSAVRRPPPPHTPYVAAVES